MDVFLIPLEIIIPLAVVLIILIAVMWILYYKNRQLNSILVSEKKRFGQYKKGIENLKNSNQDSSKEFETLNKFIRAFFKEYFQLDFSLTYLELQEHFKKQNDQQYAELCKLMSDKKYSGEKGKKEEIKKLTSLFQNILLKYEEKNQ